MTFPEHASPNFPMPGSPPDLSGSKSSKSSSFHSSYQSDDQSILSDVGHFEDIGLDDESRAEAQIGNFEVKTSSNPYDVTYNSDLRSAAKQRKRVPMSNTHGNRVQRELTAAKRPAYPSLRGQIRSATADGLGLLPLSNPGLRRFSNSSVQSLPMTKRNRSSSPNIPRSPSYNKPMQNRRSSWQSNKERKSALELEKECDEDDGDDVPDEFVLENVPISPRPPQERIKSTPPSASTSPERRPKEKVRSVGNGTSPRPAEQGELRSPRSGMSRNASMGQFPINHDHFPKGRAKSWTAALSELSPEAKALTEALEAHADDEDQKVVDPRMRRSFTSSHRHKSPVEKQRVKSAIAELPPLRRTDIMIDPLPISKEKEAVLSRTRPSWLPPKDPAEEKKHLKQYQKMMAAAQEAEKRKEAERRAKTTCRDDTASSLLRIWEEHVLPNWNEATRQKRTRELWWRGIAPRSRGAVWTKAIGNELGLSDSSYTAALRRARALEKTITSGSQLSGEELKKKAWLDRIAKDAETTYTELRIFQPAGPLHENLLDVLKAYAMYRSDVGYVSGTSTIAALLLLNMPNSSAAFSALSNLLNRPLALSFHTSDSGATSRAYSLIISTLERNSPELHKHLTSLHLNPEIYLREIFTSLMTGCLSLDNATRLWDIMVFEGDAVMVRAGVAWLMGLESRLFGADSPKAVYEITRRGLDNMDEETWIAGLRAAGRH